MAFLIRVHADLDASPGVYEGNLTVSWGAADTMQVAVAVTVWDFEIPQRGHLRTCLMTTWSDPKNMWPDRSWSDHEAVTAALLKVGEVAARNRMYPCTLASGLLSWDWQGQGATHMGWPTHDCKPDNSGCLFNDTRTGFLLDWLRDRGESPSNRSSGFVLPLQFINSGNWLLKCVLSLALTVCAPLVCGAGTPGVLIGLTSNMYLTKDTAAREATLAAYLRDYVPFLQSRGQLDDAYLYGVDEPWGAAVQQATQTASFVKTQQPDLKFLQNTNQNNSNIDEEDQSF